MSVSSQTARVAVFHAVGEPMELRSIELNNLDVGEALVAVECCTLCSSDLHSIKGDRVVSTPTILGHEIVGRLVEIASDLRDLSGLPLAVGDRVSWSIIASCDQCFFCREGLPQKCDKLFKYGHQAVDQQHPLSGGLATHCRLRTNTKTMRVPDELPDLVACPANCATATVAAAMRTAGGCGDKSVLIMGAGLLGLTAAAMARHQGARHVVVSDIDQERARRSLNFGATHIDTNQIAAMTNKRGADVVFEMSGSPDAVESALDYVRIGGHLILAGAVFPGRAISMHADQVVRRMLRVEGIHNYKPEDLRNSIRFLTQTHRLYPFHRLVEREFGLSEINEAVQFALQKKPVRIAIRPNQQGNQIYKKY